MKLYEHESVDNKLFRLKEISKILDEMRAVSREDFVKEVRTHSAAMFNLLIGITIILDIGQHILSHGAQRTARNYKEVIRMLGEEKIVPAAFAREHENMPSFRNMLVHEYDKIDLALVYDYIQNSPQTFQKFAAAFVSYMNKIKESGSV